MLYQGYHVTESLPFKVGDSITIRKGTMVYQVHGDRGEPAKRTFKVRVQAMSPGTSITIAEVAPDGQVSFQSHWRDLAHLCRKFGIDTSKLPYDTEAFVKLFDLPIAELRKVPAGAEVWLHMSDPRLAWPGARGYWREVNINDVTPP